MKLNEIFKPILEWGNTKLKNSDLITVLTPSDEKTVIYFKENELNKIYAVGIQLLDFSATPMDKQLKDKLLKLKVCAVEFGTVKSVGEEVKTKYIKTSHSSALKTLSIIKNLVDDFSEYYNIDIIIFNAKDYDGMFSKRSALYTMIIKNIYKSKGYSYKIYSRTEGMDYLIFRSEYNLSKKKKLNLKN